MNRIYAVIATAVLAASTHAVAGQSQSDDKFISPAMAAKIDLKPNADRYVADDIEIETLPNGEIVTRLVSRSRLTARQFWINSVYYPEEYILVFQGQGGATRKPSDLRSWEKKRTADSQQKSGAE